MTNLESVADYVKRMDVRVVLWLEERLHTLTHLRERWRSSHLEGVFVGLLVPDGYYQEEVSCLRVDVALP